MLMLSVGNPDVLEGGESSAKGPFTTSCAEPKIVVVLSMAVTWTASVVA